VILAFVGIDSGSEVLQALVNGVINGCAYGLLAVGFALILSVTGRFHFAYAFTYALAAFLAAVLERVYGLPLLPAAAAGLAAAAVVGVACDTVVYRPLAERAGSGAMLAVFVASLGIVIAGENALSLAWGPGRATSPVSGRARSTSRAPPSPRSTSYRWWCRWA